MLENSRKIIKKIEKHTNLLYTISLTNKSAEGDSVAAAYKVEYIRIIALQGIIMESTIRRVFMSKV